MSGEVQRGLPAVLDSIVRQVEAVTPGFVIVDSFRSVLRVGNEAELSALDVQDLVQWAGASPHHVGGDDLPRRRVSWSGG